MSRTKPLPKEVPVVKRMKKYESIRHQMRLINQMKTKFSKDLKMNEEDYMKEYRSKAAQLTKQLNLNNPGDGSSAIFNLNMHQDFIINKLGLIKKLKGHDLIIKTLLFKIFGIKTNDEDMK